MKRFGFAALVIFGLGGFLQAAMADYSGVRSLVQHDDGRFEVVCKDGTNYIVTFQEIEDDTICVVDSDVCATKDSYVHFQVPGSGADQVQCLWQKVPMGDYRPFFGAATYDFKTRRWTCPNWTVGDTQNSIIIDVNNAEYHTSESAALAHPCPN